MTGFNMRQCIMFSFCSMACRSLFCASHEWLTYYLQKHPQILTETSALALPSEKLHSETLNAVFLVHPTWGDPCHGGSLNQQASPGQKYTPKSENIKDARGNIQEHSDPECFKITMWAGFELSEPCHHFWFPSLHTQASPVKSMQDSLVFPQPKYHWFLGPGYYRNPQGIIGSKLEIHWAWWYWWYNVTQNLVLSAEIGKWRSSHKASSRFKLLNPSCPRKPATVERSKSIGLPCVVPIAKHVFLLWEFETGLPISDAVNAWLRATIPWRSRSW